ncbi:MAG TPA: M20/M25/M40 family metallo-hydrolase [Acidimicrobiales bacterium]|nr:M20/M25/M40 family metallo-hydrolase [Acidimicrobiales bacterium]
MTQAFVDDCWDAIVPVLEDYIRIPNKSPVFDPEWEANGHMDRAVDLIAGWLQDQGVDGLTLFVHRLPGLTPVIVAEAPATDPDITGTVLLYGHLDKQPEMVGWLDGFGPWEPRRDGDRLYGRGAGDDGYAAFAALTAIRAVREGGGRHARCVVLIEASEESGSPDLPAHIDALARGGGACPAGWVLGEIDLVVCLDSGCSDYDRLWVTTSLRGLVGFDLRVDVLTEGVHSGSSGVVPSSFRILRALLSRIEDEATGRILVPGLHADIPAERVEQARQAAAVLGPDFERYPYAGATRPMVEDPAEQILAATWRPALSVTGLDGAPRPQDAGNVLRPSTTAKLSIRLPPTCDHERALDLLTEVLTADPPHGALVSVTGREAGPGWDAPATAAWLSEAADAASRSAFGQPPGALGIGGSIPFMAMLGHRFPEAQFLVTGVMGPGSNAHGPNEFLDLPTARRVTACVAGVLDAHARAV